VVEPKRAKLREAEAALADANRKLEEKQAVLKQVGLPGNLALHLQNGSKGVHSCRKVSSCCTSRPQAPLWLVCEYEYIHSMHACSAQHAGLAMSHCHLESHVRSRLLLWVCC
jgi:hypothetical protein